LPKALLTPAIPLGQDSVKTQSLRGLRGLNELIAFQLAKGITNCRLVMAYQRRDQVGVSETGFSAVYENQYIKFAE
jgi:hypothetical protein